MDIRIEATLVDTLKYRLYAQATVPPGGTLEVDVVPVVGGKARQRPAEASAPPAALIAPAPLPPAELSAAIRALRERTYREVQSQVEHFCRTTGRVWQIRTLHYGELLPEAEARAQMQAPATRLTLITEVELRATLPTLH